MGTLRTDITNAIIERGNRSPLLGVLGADPDVVMAVPNIVVCMDGFAIQVLAGWGARSIPAMPPYGILDPGYGGPYTHVECAYPTERPEPFFGVWESCADEPGTPTLSRYPRVPAERIRRLIREHDGEDLERTLQLARMQAFFMFGPENFGPFDHPRGIRN